MATQEQFAALMAQTSALTAAVAQMADFQQGAASKGSQKGGIVIDARHLRLATFDGTSSRYDEWSFSFKRAIRSASCATYKLLAQVEVEPNEVQEDQMTDEFEGSGLRASRPRSMTSSASRARGKRLPAFVQWTTCAASQHGRDYTGNSTLRLWLWPSG